MSSLERLKTTVDDERIINDIRRALLGRNLADDDEQLKLDKWYVLRLALTFSFALADDPDPIPEDAALNGGDYRLAQVTGDGKGENDFTDLFRILLSVRHGIDLFDRAQGHHFIELLLRHIHRGLQEIERRRRNEDIHEFLHHEFSRLAGTALAEPETIEPPRSAETIVNALREMGIRCEVRGIDEGPRLSRYRLYLPIVSHFDILNNGREKLAFQLGLAGQGLVMKPSAEPKEVELFLPRLPNMWRHFKAHDFRAWVKASAPGVLPMWPGVDILGKPYEFDLVTAPHLFVAGTTGSGKSVCLHALICSLLLSRPANTMQFCFIDTKMVELSAYRSIPHLWGGRIHVTVDEISTALTGAVEEMERRQAEFVKLGVRDLAGANARGGVPMPYLIVVVEELADLIMKEQGPAMEQLLIRIAQKGRSSGIHLILSTQRPDSKTFSGLLRSNIPSRIALAVQKSTESKIILDDLGAERLLKPGDMMVRLSSGDPVRVHGVYLGPEDVAQMIQQVKERKS